MIRRASPGRHVAGQARRPPLTFGRRRQRLELEAPKTRLTLEGVYCLFVLSFIFGGAVLRNVNLLVLLGGLLMAPLLWSWLWSRLAMSGVTVWRQAEERVFAGRPLLVRFGAVRRAWSVPSWGLAVRQRWRPEWDRAVHPEWVQVVIPRSGTERAGTASYAITFPERGWVCADRTTVSTRFPLGLCRTTRLAPAPMRVLVWPALARLTPAWDAAVAQRRWGHHTAAPRRGFSGGEYYGLREWRPGDARRLIHWRTTARLGRVMVREFEREEDRQLSLAVDLVEPETESGRAAVEDALVLLTSIVHRQWQCRGALTLAMSAKTTHIWHGTVYDGLAREILDVLAVVEPRPGDVPCRLPGREASGRAAPMFVITTSDHTDVFPGVPADQIATPDIFRTWLELPEPVEGREEAKARLFESASVSQASRA